MANAFSPERLAQLHANMEKHVASGRMPGLVALAYRHGETHVDVIGRMAFDGPPMARDTIFRIASLTKPIVAAAAMALVEDCVLRLDDPLDDFLPELANRRVLRSIDAAVDDTVPADRAITLRDLLTFRLGLGAVMMPPGTYPIQALIEEVGVGPGFFLATCTPDEFMQRLGDLPLVYQPGERWLYHTPAEVLGVLIARAAGRSLEQFCRERIFAPLGMNDTSFMVAANKLDRLPPAYMTDQETGGVKVFDAAGSESRWSKEPPFPSAGGGLASTVDDYLTFCRMMLGMGKLGDVRILSRPAVAMMTSDQVPAAQRAGQEIFFSGGQSWGFGMSVAIRRDQLWNTPGRFGWDGGYGASSYCDPAENLAGILFTQRTMEDPSAPEVFSDFWTGVYSSIEDA